MRLLKRLWLLVFPERASTQTWMILTFALFVGMAVVAVGLYMAFVLRDETREVMRQTLQQQAERIAEQVEGAETLDERYAIVRDIARLTDFRVTVASSDSLYWDVQGRQLLSDGQVLAQPEMRVAPRNQVRFSDRVETAGVRMLYVALYRPESSLIVRVGQPEPPLFAMVERMQIALLVGMAMALLLSILGSWVAAYQVTTPLKAIRNSAWAIAQDQFDEKIRVDSRAAEFQDLGESLNRMSDSFRKKIDELERLTRLQSEFIGNVSHEVRNPIFAISGYLEALSMANLRDEQRKRYAEKALANLQRLNALFNDLIEIARLEYREDLIRPDVFDLQELTHEVAEMLRPKAERQGLHLEVENVPVLVKADRNRIRQVLTNLIDNAIAYTEEGTIRCRFRRRLDKVRVEVVDTGRGIEEDHLDRIFERFYRINPDRSRKSGGTGLGLSIVKQILQAHDEPIHVESTFGRGTRFWFELPYAGQAQAADAERPEQTAHASADDEAQLATSG